MSGVDPHATIRDDQSQGQVAWWESTPADPGGEAPPPDLTAPGFGALLTQHGRAVDDEPDGPRYAVERLLGAGSGGMVWSVHDQRLDRPVAIKVMARTAGDGQRALRAFVGEARIAASLNHPHVLAIHDLDLTREGDACFVMQRIEGISLGDLLRARQGGEVPEPIADANAIVSIFIAVGQALAYAHHHGVVHQDVKPDNILIGRFGEVLLVDWGCAVRGKGLAGRLTGTPIYMAPEQARCEGAHAGSDVYCLGGSLFHALVGRPPLPPGEDPKIFWERKRGGDLERPTAQETAGISAPLLAIALRSLAVDAADRYANAEAFVADLRNYQAGLAIEAYRDGLWASLGRWYRRHRAPFWVAAVAVVFITGALALYLSEKLREHAQWQVVLAEDFTDPTTLESRWMAVGFDARSWKDAQPIALPAGGEGSRVSDGVLNLGDPAKVMNLVTRERFSGDLLVEWTTRSPRTAQNLNVFLGSHRFSGYIIHIGGFGDPAACALTRAREDLILQQARLPEPLTVGRTVHMRIQREGYRLRFWMDGQPIIDYADLDGDMLVGPTQVGFDTWSGSGQIVDWVRISTRPLPQRVSPIAVGTAFAHAGDHARAAEVFADLSRAHRESDIGIEACFREAFARMRLDEGPAVAAGLVALAEAHRDHVLAPYAWMVLAERYQGEDPIIRDRARMELARFPGALQQRVLQDIGRDRLAELGSALPISERFRDIEVCEEVVAELLSWEERYGIRAAGNNFINRLVPTCLHFGRMDLAAAGLASDHRIHARVAIECGRFDEALAGWPHLPSLHTDIAARKGEAPPAGSGRQRFLEHSGDREAALAEEEWSAWAQICLGQDDAAAVLVEERAPAHLRQVAALDLGRWDEAIALEPRTFRGPETLLAQIVIGDPDEVIADDPWTYLGAVAAAIEFWRRGDLVRARHHFAALRERCPDHAQAREVEAWWLWQIPFLLEEDQRPVAQDLLDRVAANDRCNSQRSAHVARFILGRIDEAAFLAQPYQKDVDLALLSAGALRAAWMDEDTVAVRAAWKAVADGTPPRSYSHHLLRRYAAWLSQR